MSPVTFCQSFFCVKVSLATQHPLTPLVHLLNIHGQSRVQPPQCIDHPGDIPCTEHRTGRTCRTHPIRVGELQVSSHDLLGLQQTTEDMGQWGGGGRILGAVVDVPSRTPRGGADLCLLFDADWEFNSGPRPLSYHTSCSSRIAKCPPLGSPQASSNQPIKGSIRYLERPLIAIGVLLVSFSTTPP